MGCNHYKVPYECDCGCDYGSCGRRSYYLMRYHRGSDTATIYHNAHADDPKYPDDGKLEVVALLTDNGLDALRNLLDGKHTEHWSSADHASLK
jgi:hypothetical protein